MNPQEAFEKELLPRIQAALERGAKRGEMWRDDALARGSVVTNAEHVASVHIRGRVAEAIELIDYGFNDAAYDKLASAVGYMGVLIAQTEML